MKKILLVIAVVICAGTSYAQGVSGGIKAGVNFSNQTYSGSGFNVTPDGLVGFHGGLYLKAMFSEKLGLQPEILYSVRGTKTTIGNTTQTNTFSYLNIPVLLRYNVVEQFNIQAGPQVGINLAADSKVGSSSSSIKDQVASSDISLAFGAGVDFGAFNAGLRYSLGLSNIQKDASGDDSIKNNNFQIYLGFRLFGE